MNTARSGPPGRAADIEITLEGLELTAEAVASHGDVDGTETALVGAPVDGVGAEQDHPRARPEGREPGRELFPERVGQARGLEEHRHRRRLTPGEDDAVEPGEILGSAHPPGRDPDLAQCRAVLSDVALERQDADVHLEAPRRRVVTVAPRATRQTNPIAAVKYASPPGYSGGVHLDAGGHRVGDVLLGDHTHHIRRPGHAAAADDERHP